MFVRLSCLFSIMTTPRTMVIGKLTNILDRSLKLTKKSCYLLNEILAVIKAIQRTRTHNLSKAECVIWYAFSYALRPLLLKKQVSVIIVTTRIKGRCVEHATEHSIHLSSIPICNTEQRNFCVFPLLLDVFNLHCLLLFSTHSIVLLRRRRLCIWHDVVIDTMYFGFFWLLTAWVLDVLAQLMLDF